MPAFKKQHYLPSSYLKYFSTDQTLCNRTSLVWRFDKTTCHPVVVESQCFGDYFYSKQKPAEIEQMFQTNEGAYSACVERIRNKQEPHERDIGDLLLAMFDLYLRNAAHKNRTGLEGIEAYSQRVGIFLGQILLSREEGEILTSEVKHHMEQYWRVRIVSCPPSHQFLTSDHPSIWRTLGRVVPGIQSRLHLMALPLTPHHLAVAYDNRLVEINGDHATTADVGYANFSQVQNAEKSIYISKQLPPEQLQKFQNFFANKPLAPSESNEEGWQIAWIPLPDMNYFSFMKLKGIPL